MATQTQPIDSSDHAPVIHPPDPIPSTLDAQMPRSRMHSYSSCKGLEQEQALLDLQIVHDQNASEKMTKLSRHNTDESELHDVISPPDDSEVPQESLKKSEIQQEHQEEEEEPIQFEAKHYDQEDEEAEELIKYVPRRMSESSTGEAIKQRLGLLFFFANFVDFFSPMSIFKIIKTILFRLTIENSKKIEKRWKYEIETCKFQIRRKFN